MRPVRGLTRDVSTDVNMPSPNTSETTWWGGGGWEKEGGHFSSSLLTVEMAKFLELSLLEICPRLSCRLLSPTTQNFWGRESSRGLYLHCGINSCRVKLM